VAQRRKEGKKEEEKQRKNEKGVKVRGCLNVSIKLFV
jgi:hypothetical protein